MKSWLETFLAGLVNRHSSRRPRHVEQRGISLGAQVVDGEPSRNRVIVAHDRRAEHIAVLGKTGSGKSFLLRHLASQDIWAARGFLRFEFHGDAMDFLVKTIAERESAIKEDLSDRLIVIEPANPAFSVGINPLEQHGGDNRFVQIGEITQILRQRWSLDSFGARTDELLRNSLYVLAENGLTLIELAPLLTHTAFRTSCLRRLTNAEVKQYFELRYDAMSGPMQAVMREPILNKLTSFTGDPHFRHIVGQQHSTFSIRDAMDRGCWIIFDLPKGQLGEQAMTLGALLFTMSKNALFSRRNRSLFTIYADEIQNLISFGGGIETVLSESRKFGISVVSANQFLDQYPAEMRSTILALGTHIFFQLASHDAQQIAAALDGGKPLAELLKNLPHRHMVVKTGHDRWREAVVPTVREPRTDPSHLLDRSRARWARNRNEIEEEIRRRQAVITRSNTEALHDWN